MAIRIVRLGSDRVSDEGLRLGTVRRPPRGVPKHDFSRANYYDVWLPDLSPSAPLVQSARTATSPAQWRQFTRRYRAEMNQASPRQLLDLLAALSHTTNFSVGCYCEDEQHCHRSVLRELLVERNAKVI